MIKFLYTQEGLTINDSTFLKNEELLDEDGNYNIQTELLANENRFSIKVVTFEGNDKGTKILLRNEYGYQCLIAAMKNAQNFCAEVVNQTKTVFHENGYREDVPLFDKGAFREAWYNACLHNDWVDGTPPAIYIFNNRLEIISTGGLSSNMTKDDFFGGISKPVNESLAKIFIKLGLIEQTGHGVSMIVDRYGKEAFTFLDNFLRVTIPFSYDLNSYLKPDVTENVTENVVEDVAKIQEKKIRELLPGYSRKKVIRALDIVKMISDNPWISIDEMRISLDVTDRTIARYLAEMKAHKVIERVGPDKGGMWKTLL